MPFTFEKGPLDGVMIITPRMFPDGRGFFMETFKKSDFTAAGVTAEFVQDNHSSSAKGVVRGLHYQKAPHAQGKLIRATRGVLYDVMVDIRQGSPTYGEWFGIELSAENRKMVYIPPGFAHGFVALSDTVEFLYKVTSEFNKESEAGIMWNDPEVGIKWPVTDPILSEKDAILPPLSRADNNFQYQG